MMLALLFLATLALMLAPMLPALVEWLRPSDVQPLAIDEADALDPPYLARSFAARLAEAVAAGAGSMGHTPLQACPPIGEPLPLSDAERTARASHRLWHADGDLQLPEHVAFYAEVAAAGDLQAAAGSIHKALWAGGALRLGSQSSVLRWAHGRDVLVGDGCHLAGRVTAEHRLALGPGTRFTLLQAPLLLFLPNVARPVLAAVPGDGAALQGVRWDASGARAVSNGALSVAAGTAWHGDLVCHGDLMLGPRCVVHGSLKVCGALTLGAGCTIHGNVFAEDAVDLGVGCTVVGVLMSEAALVLDTGCVVGSPAAPATVSAPRIDIGAGVQVHGTVWANEEGHCAAWHAAASETRPRTRLQAVPS